MASAMTAKKLPRVREMAGTDAAAAMIVVFATKGFTPG
jgi:hypothetical protein